MSDHGPANEQPPGPPASLEGSETAAQGRVTTALNLGWWMAEAYHFAKPTRILHPDSILLAALEYLMSLNQLQPRSRIRMYLDEVEVALKGVAREVPDAGARPSIEAVRSKLAELKPDDEVEREVLVQRRRDLLRQ